MRIDHIDAFKTWSDERVLSEYDRLDKLKLRSTLTEDEKHTFIELVREMYFRRIGHYKDYDSPRTTGLDDKPYHEGWEDHGVDEL